MENDPHPSVEFRREHFRYDQDSDCFRCPNGKELTLTRVSRSAGSSLHWVYSAQKADCQSCPMKERCLNKSLKDKARRLTRSVFEDAAKKSQPGGFAGVPADPSAETDLVLRLIVNAI